MFRVVVVSMSIGAPGMPMPTVAKHTLISAPCEAPSSYFRYNTGSPE